MNRTEPAGTDAVTEILAAMVRVLAGTPTTATPGDLTITAVVAEAQIKRHLLTHKHTELKDLFYQLRDSCSNPVLAKAKKQGAEYAELQKKLADARQEAHNWKTTAHTFARAIHVLTIEKAELQNAARAHALRDVASTPHAVGFLGDRLRATDVGSRRSAPQLNDEI